jgi:hypothetical protein
MSETFTIPISNGILTPDHCRDIGPALWVFLWMIDHTTREVPGEEGQLEGLVFGGAQVRAAVIAADLGLSVRLVHEHIKRLREYIRVIPMGEGLPSGYAVMKSKKWRKNQPAPIPETNNATSDTLQKNREPLPSTPQKNLHALAENMQAPAEKPLPILKTVQDITKQTTEPLFSSEGETAKAKKVARRFTPDDIDRVYQAYPLKVDPADAKKAIGKALSLLHERGEEDPTAFLIERIEAMKAQRARDAANGIFVPNHKNPATWFNKGSYDNAALQPVKNRLLPDGVPGTSPRYVNPAEAYSGVEYADVLRPPIQNMSTTEAA